MSGPKDTPATAALMQNKGIDQAMSRARLSTIPNTFCASMTNAVNVPENNPESAFT